jgi:hypothetical protein
MSDVSTAWLPLRQIKHHSCFRQAKYLSTGVSCKNTGQLARQHRARFGVTNQHCCQMAEFWAT